MLVDHFLDIFTLVLAHFFAVCDGKKDVKTLKKMISTNKPSAKHPLAGGNTQQPLFHRTTLASQW